MSRIRLVRKTAVVAVLLVGLLFTATLRPAPAVADTETTVIIAVSAFVGYLAVVGGLTWIIYSQRDKEKPEPPRRDPYSFTSDRLSESVSAGGLQFGSKCAGHGPGTLFCW
jgi:hypothetical protein